MRRISLVLVNVIVFVVCAELVSLTVFYYLWACGFVRSVRVDWLEI